MNPLTDILPPAVRRYTYALLFIAALVFSLFQASEGDWMEFVGGLITSLLGLVATSNTPAHYDGTIDPFYADSVTSPAALNVRDSERALEKKTITLEVKPIGLSGNEYTP